MNLTEKNTLGEWSAKYSIAGMVFFKNHLDFCCGGKESLEEACQKAGLSALEIIKQIKQNPATNSHDWSNLNDIELIDLILSGYHQKHREDLPALVKLAEKVERVHSDKDDCPKGLGEFLKDLSVSLEQHMAKEEMILFPMVKSEKYSELKQPVYVMTQEHENHGENLEKLKTLAFNFNPPSHACASWKALYSGLEQLTFDIMEHISIENNILFPRIVNH